MTRLLLAVGVGALLLAAPVRGFAEDQASPAAQSTEAAPGGDTAGGCMPGGGCCGGGKCAEAAKQDGEGSGGGCPCKKRRELQEKAARMREQQAKP